MIDRVFLKKLLGFFLIFLTIGLAIYMLTSMYKNFSALMVGQSTTLPAQKTQTLPASGEAPTHPTPRLRLN